MALKKPGDFFQRKEVVKIKEEIDQLVNPELSSLSDAFDNYKEKVNKFELLSGVIEDVQKELKDIKVEVYKKEELEETVIKSSLLLEKKIKELKEDVEKESKNVLNISSIKYRKLEEEVKKYHDKALSVIENEVGKIEEGQKSYNSKLASIKSEIFRTEDLKKVTEKVKEDLAEFQKVDYDISEKIKYMEEVFVKFNEQVTLKENVITEPPSTNNSDPLTPLDQNFVTFEQLSEHYRVFINRIQQQLSTLGGGGAVRIQDMDDIDRDSVLVNNRVLKYDAASKRFVGTNAGSQSLDDTLSFGNTSSHGMSVGVSTFNGAVIINDKLKINPDDASTTWQRELDTIHQIRDDIYLESTLNVGDKAGFDFTPLGITTFSYSGTTLTVGVTTTHALAVGKNILIKDSASGFSEAFNTIAGTTGTTVKVTRGSDPSSSLSIANTKVTVYTPTDPRGCVNVAKDYAKFNENSFNPILRGFVGIATTSAAAPNTEVFKVEIKKDASAADHVATLLHSTREFGAGQRIALTIDDGNSYPNGKNLVLTQNGVKITADDSAFTDSDELLEVEGDAKIDGNITASGIVTATDFNSTSDVKLKKNIKQIEDPISKIMSIEGVSFNWKSDNRPSLGVIADQLENILPELVSGGDTKTVNYNGLVGLLIECVKNQQKQIDELKDQLNN